jgi:hypothetical protein
VAGSMIQAAQAKPMSAMPSSVFDPGVSQSSTLIAAGAEFGYLSADVADLPRCLGLLVGGPDGALGHVQAGAVAVPESDGILVLPVDLQTELAEVELPGHGEVGGQQRGSDRMVSKPGNVTPVVRAPAGLRGLDIGVVVEQVLRVVLPLDRADAGPPSASVTRSRAASRGRIADVGRHRNRRWPVAPMRSLASLTSSMSPRTMRVPRSARPAAMAWPMPRPAPVTSATRPAWGSEVLFGGMWPALV